MKKAFMTKKIPKNPSLLIYKGEVPPTLLSFLYASEMTCFLGFFLIPIPLGF